LDIGPVYRRTGSKRELRAMVQDQSIRVGRRLSAILAADVAGYSRLMGLDEAGTARILREHRTAIDSLVERHSGRIVKTTGDGLLLEFPSVVDAVDCAVAVQTAMEKRNEGVPKNRRMLLRIGINLGDILIEGDDILGDGVNIAARLEGIAEPGGICISYSAYDQIRGKVAVEFIDLGEQTLKNIVRPVRVYAMAQHGLRSNMQDRGAMPNPTLAPRLSIVVLPFSNIGGDPEQGYFVDGVTESLTTDLSRIASAFVIARNSAFSYKGKLPDVRQVGRELNVRYVLEGSVQRSGNRLRINVQLIDAETGSHLWAERFDKPVADLFDMQDEIVSRLANTLNAQLAAAEAERAERSPHPDAVDLNFQGMACLNKGRTSEHLLQAYHFFERALVLDPKNVEALVGVANVNVLNGSAFMTDDRAARFAAAEATLIKALSIAPQHARALWLLGHVEIFTNRGAQGIAECEQALALDRNLARAHGTIGIAKYYLGRGAETESHVQEALRLSPRDTEAYQWIMFAAFSKLLLGSDEEAALQFRRSVEMNRTHPRTHFYLAVPLAHLGRLEEARSAVQAGLVLDPTFTISRFRANVPSDNPAFLTKRERILDGMRLAGIPEG
jgi:TolB-like protein/class 3 adenylate cyclase